MKSEPDIYSIDDLKKEKTCFWEGIRNYQARNFMRDQFRKGDLAFFYHSNTKPPGIVGVMEIIKDAYPDHTSWDSNSKYFDSKSSPDNSQWCMVDVSFKAKFKGLIPLQDLREHPQLQDLMVIQRGSRLSIQPVSKEDFEVICEMRQS